MLYQRGYLYQLDLCCQKTPTSNVKVLQLVHIISSGEGIDYPLQCSWASLVAQLVKNLPGVWETWVRSLGWEDPLEKGMAIHSSILAWRIPWTEEPGGLQSMGLQSWTQLSN